METLLGFCSLPLVFMVHAKPEKHKTVSPNSKQWKKSKPARVTIWAGKVCSSKSKPAKLTPELSAFPCHRKDPQVFKVGESRKMPQQIRWVIYDQFRPDVTLQTKKKILVQGMFIRENAIGDTHGLSFAFCPRCPTNISFDGRFRIRC